MDRRLETFLAVCQTMNYRRAAEALHLTQPAVTKQIQSLEASYGVRLFSYDGRKLRKTAPGSVLEVLLYAIARHMVVGHESALDNLISVGAIALIFVVRKFFFVPAFGAHLPDGKPAPDLTPNQSGIPAEEFRTRLRQRIHAEALADEEDDEEDDETEEV